MPSILGANEIKATGFNVANSARFNDDDGAYLDHTHGAVTSTRKQTFSFWIKRGLLGSYISIISTRNGSGTDRDIIAFTSDDQFDVRYNAGNSSPIRLTTNRVFRDVAAWYHIVVAVDTTQGTAGNRIKVYVNGVQETSFTTSNYMDQNYDFALNAKTDQTTDIGNDARSDGNYWDGYMAEFVAIDGSQNAPTDFGEFDEDSPNIWKPKDGLADDLTFGNAGFYMNFQTAAELGTDVSGNSNTFSENNLVATDQSTDTCTNNFCTMNSLNVPTSSGPTFSEGNLVSISTNANFGGSSTIGMTTGKWYCEAKCVTDSTIRNAIGITGETGELARDNNAPTSSASDQSSIGYLAENGNKYNPAAGDQGSSYGDSYANDDIIGIAMDLDNMKLYFSKNGTFQDSGDPTSGATGTGAIAITVAVADTIDGAYFVCQGSAGASTSRFDWNFGSPPYAVSSGNSDGNGHGNFEYSVPSGYLAWCTKNLGSDGG